MRSLGVCWPCLHHHKPCLAFPHPFLSTHALSPCAAASEITAEDSQDTPEHRGTRRCVCEYWKGRACMCSFRLLLRPARHHLHALLCTVYCSCTSRWQHTTAGRAQAPVLCVLALPCCPLRLSCTRSGTDGREPARNLFILGFTPSHVLVRGGGVGSVPGNR